MIYAIRQNGVLRTLIELPSHKHLKPDMEHIRPSRAHKWVREGKEHETGLFLDGDGRLRHAPPQSAQNSPSDRSAPSIGSTPRIDRTSDGARE